MTMRDEVYFPIKKVARLLGVSERWLADRCRQDLVEHVHIARKRRFTPEQVQKLLNAHTVRPEADRRVDAARARVRRALARQRR